MSNDASSAMEQEKKLRQLIELAEDNQLAVQDAIVCLTAEREAFTRERAALVKASVSSAEVSNTLRLATAEAIPAIAAATEKAIRASMGKALGTTTPAAGPTAWGDVAHTALDRFGSVAQLASGIEERLRRASQRFLWQWSTFGVLAVTAIVVVAAVGVQQLRSQQAEVQRQQAGVQRQQADLQAQKTAFSEEMARMQASVTFLERKGGRVHLDKCGPEQRLCIEVAPDQGSGRNNFRGVWSDKTNERSFVIPKGY